MISFRAFLFQRQNSRCYLRTTQACQQRDGVMRFDGKRKGNYASKEHVIPRSKKAKGERALLLLACCNCNNRKGAEDPDPEHLDLARRLDAEYRSHWWSKQSPQSQRRALAKAFGVSFDQADYLRDELSAQAVILKIDADMLEAGATKRKRRARENAEMEAVAAARKSALGLDRYDDSSKVLSKLRRAANIAMGR